MTTRLGRRKFLEASAATSIVVGTQFFTVTPAFADFAAGPAIRRNASKMAANDPILVGYRRAIQRMRGLADTNPCSWFYQAAIHGTLDPRNLASWNTCHTDPTFFWAWHRMYLYFFERIVRKYSGMYDWAVPFWDWTNPAELPLPAPFRDSASLLFDATRKPVINGGAPLSTSLGTSIANAMTLLDYFNTQSSVNGPHGSVHGAIGGNMGSVISAAQDPIFYVHHSEVDRQWNLWLAQGGGRSSPVGNNTWRNTTYTFFDECCQAVRMRGCDVVRAARQLSYSYEGEPPQVEQYCPRFPFNIRDLVVLVQWRRPFILREKPIRIRPIPPDPRIAIPRIVEALRGQRTLALRLSDVVADIQPEISWEVHVGPAGFAPNPRSLVGMFGLFGSGLRSRKDHFHPAEFVFPLNKAVAGFEPARLEVLFVPVSGLGGDRGAQRVAPRSPVTVGTVAIIVDAPMPELPRDEQEALRREELSR